MPHNINVTLILSKSGSKSFNLVQHTGTFQSIRDGAIDIHKMLGKSHGQDICCIVEVIAFSMSNLHKRLGISGGLGMHSSQFIVALTGLAGS